MGKRRPKKAGTVSQSTTKYSSLRTAKSGSSVYKRKRKRRGGILGRGGILILVAILIIAALIFIFTSKNSYETFIDGQSIGILNKKDGEAHSKEVIIEKISEKLQQELGTAVNIESEIVVEKIRADKENFISPEELLFNAREIVEYSSQAARILVDGAEIGIVASSSAAEDVFEAVYAPYKTEFTTESGFLENVVTESIYVHKDEIMDNEVLVSRLSELSPTVITYNVVSGDTLGGIAAMHGITLGELLNANPDLGQSTMLRVGQAISIPSMAPFVTVKTVDTILITEALPRETQYVSDPSRPAGYKKVIEPGSDGLKEITYQQIKINGILQSENVVSENIIKPSTPQIISVGE